MTSALVGLGAIVGVLGLIAVLLSRPHKKTRMASSTTPAAVAAGGTTGAGATTPAPGAAASTSTTPTTTTPTPANKWSWWAKKVALLVVGGLVLWLIIIGPADWMGDVARFNWATSIALGAWLADIVGADLANLLMWGLVAGVILLTVIILTGKHKGWTKTFSSIPITTLLILGVVAILLFPVMKGIGKWAGSPDRNSQTVTFQQKQAGERRFLTVGPLDSWKLQLRAMPGPNRHSFCATSDLSSLRALGQVFEVRRISTWTTEYRFTPEARVQLTQQGVREVQITFTYYVRPDASTDPCVQQRMAN